MPDVEKLGYKTDTVYLAKVIGLIKEKVNFASEIPAKASFFFEDPPGYDMQLAGKKWNAQAAGVLKGFCDRLNEIGPFEASNIEESLKSYTAELAVNTGQIFQPLRLSLSGEGGGPPLFEMMALLGRETCIRRILKAIDTLGTTS
jgi:glutamyl-tRNA synthetase